MTAHGAEWGLPVVFTGDFKAFGKGAELMLSVGSSLLGFIIAAVTLIYALTAGARFELLRNSSSFSDLAAASRASMFWLLAVSLLGAALVLVSSSAFGSLRPILIFTAVFVSAQAAISTTGLTWIIGRLVTLA